MLFERGLHANQDATNNTTDMYIEPAGGEVYIFKLPKANPMNRLSVKRLLSTNDPYMWLNDGNNKQPSFGTERTFFYNLNEHGEKTGFEKCIHTKKDFHLALVEYIGEYTNGRTRADKYYHEAVKLWQSQEIKNQASQNNPPNNRQWQNQRNKRNSHGSG